MKKITSLCLVLATLITLCAPVSAASIHSQVQTEELRRLEKIAYLDVDTASPEERQEILNARNVVIYTKDWVADGTIGWVEDITTGDVIRYIPSFSEVFPGWDIPKAKIPEKVTDFIAIDALPSQQANRLSDWTYMESYRTYLEKASDTVAATPFVFVVNESYKMIYLRSYAEELTSSKTCNIGFSDFDTFESLGYKLDLGPKEAFAISISGRAHIHVRASTNSIPGYATMALESRRI